MTKQGNWGTWAIIEKPKKPQKMENISCELCASYDSRVKNVQKILSVFLMNHGRAVKSSILNLNMILQDIGIN